MSLKSSEALYNLNHKLVTLKNASPETWTVNDKTVLKFDSSSEKLKSFIEIDGCLYDRKNKRNIEEHDR